MSNSLLQTESVTFSEILGNWKKCYVPIYQRDYTWVEENWSDLLEDLKTSFENEKECYLWAIVTLSKWKGFSDLIDWQQRLTTLTIVTLAIIKILEDLIAQKVDVKDNEYRINEIKRDYIGSKEKAWLKYSPHLTLNENNQPFFHTYIIDTGKDLKSIKWLTESNKLLRDCVLYFIKELKDFFKSKWYEKSWEKITEFLEVALRWNLKFILIEVKDEASAFTVFETLNSKWVWLSTTDLLKNLLFSLVADNGADLEVMKHSWKELVLKVWMNNIPEFLRYYVGSFSQIPWKKELYSKIKDITKTKEDAYSLIEKMIEFANFYVALEDNEDELWDDFKDSEDIKNIIEKIELLGTTQFLSLWMSWLKYLPKTEIREFLNIIFVILFRYTTIWWQNPKVVEQEFNKVSIKLSSNKIATAKQVFHDLKGKLYPSDDEFYSYFSTKSIKSSWKNKKLIKYILWEIYHQKDGIKYEYNSNKYNIEHILPENRIDETYKSFSDEEFEKNVYRLWNYLLLEKKINKDCGSLEFNDKLKKFKESRIILVNNFSATNWNMSELNWNQNSYANSAKTIWKINF